MKIEDFPKDIKEYLIPKPVGDLYFRCLGCGREFSIDKLLYVCPECKSVLMLEDRNFKSLKERDGKFWKRLFDLRKMLNYTPIKGIFRYYEFIAPIIPLEHIIYLGEGHTPLVEANERLRKAAGRRFYFKLDGLNPSASFKDRGMACALSYINYYVKERGINKILTICASTGDTSASAALYASYLEDFARSAVILPHGKVTPQQLSQPLSSGAKVIEIPGVFDDCMRVVERLSERYPVALLNSKNSWRILGQESFSYEVSQDLDYEMDKKVVVLPIGNAGNITAVIRGFIKFFKAGVISTLPKIIGVQSEHADPVFRYYRKGEKNRRFVPVKVRPSVAQAAMIGNPVSMPRVIELVEEYNGLSDKENFFVVQVKEQEIMDSMLIANRNGNIVCTQGGESLAGFIKAIELGLIDRDEEGILDSTAHMLKFIGFQEMYFNDSFPEEFNIKAKEELINTPILVRPKSYIHKEKVSDSDQYNSFIDSICEQIANLLDLK